MPNTQEKKLYEYIETEIGKQTIKNCEIPSYITNNLKHNLFDWQKETLQYFLTYNNTTNNLLQKPSHLMFNMATGSGKTLIMAASLLYYYKQGYRHFIFFVNRNNIIDKTESNFLDKHHAKYLFTDKIVIDNKTVSIKPVDVFSDISENIEIKFTSIQKLYNDIHIEKENSTTLHDLHKKNIVMLADEAHHLNTNTNTKKETETIFYKEEISSKQDVERLGWEHTVIELILNKNNNMQNNNTNILLEFTATIPENKNVVEKYNNKIIYEFPLKTFLQAGYTKEINLISSTLSKKERILHALLFAWYRHEIALQYDIANFKPVMLLRSKTIAESKTDYEEFLTWVDRISKDDFTFLKSISNDIQKTEENKLFEMGHSRTQKVLQYRESNKISFSKIAQWIKDNYQEKNIIITNSGTNTDKEKTDAETESLLNSLENKNNHIRAIFTVNRLTEGWDVLNLFDIVRLYQGQNAGGSNTKTPKTTTEEKQLIGRGVRYYPFTFEDHIKNKRKFDNKLDHDLRILEELYYYTYDEKSKYISHLKQELKKDGYISDNKIYKEFAIKNEFKNTNLYKNAYIWQNKQEDNPDKQKNTLQNIKNKEHYGTYNISSFEFHEENAELSEQHQGRTDITKNVKHFELSCKDIEPHVFYKAIHIKAKKSNSLYRFNNLQKELDIKSIDNLQEDTYLGKLKLKITAPSEYNQLSASEKLHIALCFLSDIEKNLQEYSLPKIGSKNFYPKKFENIFKESKTKVVEEKAEYKNFAKDNEWYVLNHFYGTDEEKALADFIKEKITSLEKQYENIYLLRNEEIYKIYDFEQGRGFQPDFLLFLQGKNNTDIYWQIIIEAKGDIFKDSNGLFGNSKEGWKEKFLEEISKKYGNKKSIIYEHSKYYIIGLPFYNKNSKEKLFEKKFKKLVVDNK